MKAKRYGKGMTRHGRPSKEKVPRIITPAPAQSEPLTAQNQRFRAMWAMLLWEGELRNSRLQELLGLQVVQVSRLIATFRTDYPGVIERGPGNPPRYLVKRLPKKTQLPSLDEYLALTISLHRSEVVDARIAVPDPTPEVFAALRKACVEKRVVMIRYASMREPEGTARGIVPTHLVRFGRRWHVRAWCLLRSSYRDFNLSRIVEIVEVLGSSEQLPADARWNKKVEVRLAPHCLLTPAQQALVRREVCEGHEFRKLRVRAALLPYSLIETQAAVDPVKQKPPLYQLEVMHPESLTEYLFPAE